MIAEIKANAAELLKSLNSVGHIDGVEKLKLEDVYELMFFNAKRQNNLDEAREIMQAFREEMDVIDPTRLEEGHE